MRRAVRPIGIGVAPVLGVIVALALAGGASGVARGIPPCAGNEDATTLTKKTYTGSNQPETIQATGKDSTIYGKGGDDVICAQGNDDKLYGGKDDDELWGEAGDDRLIGGKGGDDMYGGEDTDICKGGRGQNLLVDCEQSRRRHR